MARKSVYRSIDIVNSVSKLISTNQLIKTKDRLLLATSGGQDSISLLVVLNQLTFQMNLHLTLFWCHHLWQIDSFYLMRQMAKTSFLFKMDSCFVVTPKPVSSELLARNWRYSCSYRVSVFYNCHKISLAHSGSDRVETILLNLMRGTGTAGLSPLHWTKTISEKSPEKKHISQFPHFSFFCWSGFLPQQELEENSGVIWLPSGVANHPLTAYTLCLPRGRGWLATRRVRTKINRIAVADAISVNEVDKEVDSKEVDCRCGMSWNVNSCVAEPLPRTPRDTLYAVRGRVGSLQDKGAPYSSCGSPEGAFQGPPSCGSPRGKGFPNCLQGGLTHPSMIPLDTSSFFVDFAAQPYGEPYPVLCEGCMQLGVPDTADIFDSIGKYSNFALLRRSPTAVGQFYIPSVYYDCVVCETSMIWSKRWGRRIQHFRCIGVIRKRNLQLDNLHFYQKGLNEYWKELFVILTTPISAFPAKPFGVPESGSVTLESLNFFVNTCQVAPENTNLSILPIRSRNCIKTKNTKWFHRISSAFFKKCYSALEQAQLHSVPTNVQLMSPEFSGTPNCSSAALVLLCSLGEYQGLNRSKEGLTKDVLSMGVWGGFPRGTGEFKNQPILRCLSGYTGGLRGTPSAQLGAAEPFGVGGIDKDIYRKMVANKPPTLTKLFSAYPEGFAYGVHVNEVDEKKHYFHNYQWKFAKQIKNTVCSDYNQSFQSSKFIRRQNCLFVRPLLSLSRFETGKMCLFWRLPVYPDKSNQKVNFLRNRVRKQLLPTIKLFFNPQIENVLLQFAEITLAEDDYMNQIANRVLKKFIFSFETEIQCIMCAPAVPYVVRRVQGASLTKLVGSSQTYWGALPVLRKTFNAYEIKFGAKSFGGPFGVLQSNKLGETNPRGSVYLLQRMGFVQNSIDVVALPRTLQGTLYEDSVDVDTPAIDRVNSKNKGVASIYPYTSPLFHVRSQRAAALTGTGKKQVKNNWSILPKTMVLMNSALAALICDNIVVKMAISGMSAAMLSGYPFAINVNSVYKKADSIPFGVRGIAATKGKGDYLDSNVKLLNKVKRSTVTGEKKSMKFSESIELIKLTHSYRRLLLIFSSLKPEASLDDAFCALLTTYGTAGAHVMVGMDCVHFNKSGISIGSTAQPSGEPYPVLSEGCALFSPLQCELHSQRRRLTLAELESGVPDKLMDYVNERSLAVTVRCSHLSTREFTIEAFSWNVNSIDHVNNTCAIWYPEGNAVCLFVNGVYIDCKGVPCTQLGVGCTLFSPLQCELHSQRRRLTLAELESGVPGDSLTHSDPPEDCISGPFALLSTLPTPLITLPRTLRGTLYAVRGRVYAVRGSQIIPVQSEIQQIPSGHSKTRTSISQGPLPLPGQSAEQECGRLLWQGLPRGLNDVSTNSPLPLTAHRGTQLGWPQRTHNFVEDVELSKKTESARLSKAVIPFQRIPRKKGISEELFSQRIASAKKKKNQTLFFVKGICLTSMITGSILHFAMAADDISESGSNLLRYSEAQLFTRGFRWCLAEERFDMAFTFHLIIHFNRLKIETSSPLVVSSLPLALQRRVAKLFLTNCLAEEIRYSHIEKFLAILTKISL